MKLRSFVLALSLALAVPAVVHAAPDPVVQKALDEHKYAFCSKPRATFSPKRTELCSLAKEIDGCEGFAKTCETPKLEGSWLGKLAEVLGPIAHALLYLIVVAIVLAVAIPVIRALLKRSRDRQIADVAPTKNVATVVVAPPSPEEISDAEAALRDAEASRARGDFGRALALYLGASLAALDRRGVVRIAKHKTNGDYVRSCSDEAARQPLREIVREVDKVEFGNVSPEAEAVAKVASRATALVRIGVLGALVLFVSACGNLAPKGNDPAGDELPRDVLREDGWTITPLTRSLASMPVEEARAAAPILVDVDNVPLEEETAAHLERWVEAGGVLVLMGNAGRWPKALAAKHGRASTRDLTIRHVEGARIAQEDTIHDWPESVSIATLGKDVYAAAKDHHQGVVIGIANGDLFTNIGMMPEKNAAALRAIFDEVDNIAVTDRKLAIARAEDAVPPPSSPFAAIVASGLSKGAWHGLAAAMVLFLAYGIRHARARPAATAARRAFSEHVEATGAFYDRTRVFAHALAAYGRFVEMRLRERVPRGADPAAFLAARSGADPAHVAKIYERAIAAKDDDPTKGDELATIKELRTLLVKALDNA